MNTKNIAAVGAAIAVVISALTTSWISISNSIDARNDALQAKINTQKTLDATIDTAKKVDGQTHELLRAVSGQKLAEGVNEGVIQEQKRLSDKSNRKENP
jgi:hypothetical protein